MSFEILDETGNYHRIEFSQSVYAGGGTTCADGVGSCFQYVVRGNYQPAWNSQPVRGVHDPEGTLPGAVPSMRTVDTTLSVVSFFRTGNAAVSVDPTDLVALDGAYVFPRAYEQTMWPTKGLCVSGSPPNGVGFSPVDAKTYSFAPPAPLSDDGIYCVGVRPIPSDGGTASLAQTRVATLPQVVDVHSTYTPPVEQSPIIYLVVTDLQIPFADRCATSLQTITSQVSAAMNRVGVPVTELPMVNLATAPDASGNPSSCSQPATRAIAADQIAETVKQIVSASPVIHQQFHLLYFNNLSAPLPDSLNTSLKTLLDDLSTPPPGHTLQVLNWLFSPIPQLTAASGPGWPMTQQWESAIDDPTLSEALATYVQIGLPYTSQIHDPTVPVPYFTSSQVSSYAGGLFKVCNSNGSFLQTVDMLAGTRLGSPPWLIKADDPPGYLVSLNTQTDAPAFSFVEVGVDADLQVCTRYCTDHPYVATSGVGVTSWSASITCAETQ